jgi:hypothetical protein
MVDQDDDDWVGEPPEGHYTRDRANPSFWEQLPAGKLAGVGLLIVVVIAVVLLLTAS